MSSTPRRGWPVWAWLLALPLVLVAIAWIALAILLPPARVHALVQDQLHHALAREVRFTGASVGLWPPVRLSVRGLELAEPGGLSRGAAFAAERIDLDLDVLALLSHRVTVRRLALERPALHVLLRADGSTNLDSLGAPQQPGGAPPAMDIDVRAFAIRGGRVLVDAVPSGRRVAFGLATRLSLLAEQGGQRIATEGETDVTDLAFGPLSATRLADLQQGFSKLDFHVEHRGKYDAKQARLALDRLALRLGATELAFSGLVDSVGPHARFDLRAKGDRLDLAEALRWAAVADAPAVKGIAGSGTVAFDLRARGAAPAPGTPPALPLLTGTLSVRDAAFRYAGAPADVRALNLDARFAPDSLTLAPLTARVANQPVSARLLARRFADPLVDFALRGDLDLAAIAPLLAQPGLKLSGRAGVDVTGSGRAKDPGSLALSGRAALVNVGVAKPDLPKPVEGVNGVVLLSPQKAVVQHLAARAGKSSFTLDATVTRPLALMAKPDSVPPAGVTFDFRSPYLDLAELLPTTPGAPFLPNAKGSGRVAIDRLRQGKLDVTHVAAQVALAPGALEAPAFSLAGYGGTIAGNAKFDLRDTRRPVYAVHAEMKDVQANDVLSAWTPAKDLLRGALGTTIDFSGAGQQPDDVKRTLTLVGLAAITQGQLGPGPALEAIAKTVNIPALHELKFRDLKLPMRIVQGRLVTDAVHLASGTAGDWTLSGAVGFDGALDYAVSVTLPPEAVAAVQGRSALAAGALMDDQGRMLLDLRVTGPARAPRVTWDTQAMRARVTGRASQAIAEQRAKLESQAKAAAAQELQRRLGLAADSAKAVNPGQAVRAVGDSVKRAAGGLLRNFFSPKAAPADTAKH